MSSLKDIINSVGGTSRVSRLLTDGGREISPQGVNQWVRRGRVPVDWLWSFCEATGFQPWEIRPDVFPCPEAYWAKSREIEAVKKAAAN